MQVGDKVAWAGKQDPRVAPGFKGTILKISVIDSNSFKVEWEDRHEQLGKCTWERRKNLRVVDGAGPQMPQPSQEVAASSEESVAPA